MKVIFLKDSPEHGAKFRDIRRFDRPSAKKLIKKGLVEPTDEPDGTDMVALDRRYKDVDRKVESYPTNAKSIIERLRREPDPAVIEVFLQDDRKSVRETAMKLLNYGDD